MTNTTAVGNAFRDVVCQLLRTQHQDARVEQRIGGTKVDILFSQLVFGRREIFAVECKDYSSALTKTYISQNIYPVYEPLLRSGDIRRLLIVSRKPIGADAAAYVENWQGVSHQTFEELAESLVGLRPYIEKLAFLRPTDDTDYVDARLENFEGPALQHVEEWVRSGEGRGLAILGGYGQGKTSFARRLAAHYATRHLENPVERMPLLLRLGEVVHETQLEGLFGKEFTARNPCPGYQFSTLLHLNASGRLIIILDGFDEMKHAMTASDFLSNFREFNRLLDGNAKVVLLGRPNALPSDERDLVFRGKARIGNQIISSGSYAPWSERKVAFFDETETRNLLLSSLSALRDRHSEDQTYTYVNGFLEQRVAEVFRQVPSDLLRRPVHVQLISEIAANPTFDLKGFNEYRLYDHFIRTMVERDTIQKPARKSITLDARLKFQRELAWWAWRRPGTSQGCFFRHEVPATLIEALPAGNTVDDEGKRNEYIVSTLTEEKESGVLFFAHRSFQEFLVAERLRLVPPTPAAHSEISNFITPDVVAFLQQAPDATFVIDWYETLRACHGPLSGEYLEFLSTMPDLLKHIRELIPSLEVRDTDLWTVIILFLAWDTKLAGVIGNDDEQELFMLEVVKHGSKFAASAAALSLISFVQRRPGTPATMRLVSAVIERSLHTGRSENGSAVLTVPLGNEDFAGDWLMTLSKTHPARGQTSAIQLSGDLERLSECCIHILPTHVPDAWSANRRQASSPFTMEAMKVLGLMDEVVQNNHRDFLVGRGEKYLVVTVDQKRVKTFRKR